MIPRAVSWQLESALSTLSPNIHFSLGKLAKIQELTQADGGWGDLKRPSPVVDLLLLTWEIQHQASILTAPNSIPALELRLPQPPATGLALQWTPSLKDVKWSHSNIGSQKSPVLFFITALPGLK